jgi:DNA-binding transcriptional MerR regulator
VEGWTLEELTERVEAALSVDYAPQPSGRVRDVPDARVVRYYTTLGLVDRPELAGRTGLYGKRHLLQIVAIKRLQADGHPLAEIQRRLGGASDATLEKVAQVPAELPAVKKRPPVTGDPAPMRRQAFWAEAPADVEETAKEAKPIPAAKPGPAKREHEASPMVGVRLENVVLLLDAARALGSDDLDAIREAAAPLLKVLAERKLVQKEREES